jgi:phosphatidylglycerol lysyltransferase
VADRARWLARIRPIITLFGFWAALWALDHLLAEYRYRDITAALGEVPRLAIAGALVLTALGYLALVGYDVVAFRFVGLKLPTRSMILPSFMTFAVANTAPASVATAGGVRYGLYMKRGMTPALAAAVAAFNVVTYALGLCALAGLVLLLRPVSVPSAPWLAQSGRVVGAVLLGASLAYLVASRLRRRDVELLGRRLPLPSFRVAQFQLGVSVADWLFSSAALFVLLRSVANVPYIEFVGTFLVAQAAALLLPIPGGLGVFEAVVLVLSAGAAPAPDLLAGLLLYRVIYYLLPLLASGVILGYREARRLREQPRPLHAALARLSGWSVHILAFITFASGAALAASGALPAPQQHLAWLGQVLPPALVETSRFLGSIVGSALVIVAWGLEQRSRRAYQVAQVLYGTGILLALLHAADPWLAIWLLLALVLLSLTSRAFPRRDPLLREPLSGGWILAIGAGLALALWLGLLAHRNAAVAGETWWQFTLLGHGARLQRAGVGVAVTLLLFGTAKLLVRGRARHG